jgi:hypothetical protein
VEHRALADVIDFSVVTKADIAELDKLLVQFSKDLYQVFTFYSKRTNGSMSNGEFWRFVRDCKLGLKFTALSILIYIYMSLESIVTTYNEYDVRYLMN